MLFELRRLERLRAFCMRLEIEAEWLRLRASEAPGAGFELSSLDRLISRARLQLEALNAGLS